MVNKQTITDVFLTKESFNQYSLRLREQQAAKYGMTLEQWDEAVRTGATVSHNTQQPTSGSI